MDAAFWLLVGFVVVAPLLVVAFAVAAVGWRALPQARRPLARVVQEADDPDAERPRLAGLTRLMAGALAAFVLVVVAFTVVGNRGPVPDLALLALAPQAALAASLVVLAVGPLPPSLAPDAAPPARPADLAPRPLLAAVATAASALVVGLVAAGLASTTDPATGRRLALALPTVLDWTIGRGGEVVDVVYAPGGVTAPWPGWSWGGPVLAGLVVCAALAWSVVVRLAQRAGAGPAAVAASTRLLGGTFVALLTASALALALGAAMVVAGIALASAALVPVPNPEGIALNAPFTYREPMHAASLVLRYGGVGSGFGALVGVFLAGMAVAEARRGERAARVVF